ncbi:MAG: hypothetical protein Roseis2KO_25930 [Roseivirga sp.]
MRPSFIFFLLISIFRLNAQQLPEMKDWFLPTGEWGSSPELYVVEFGSGQDTVVLLHGGWGGDYTGLISAVAGLEDEFHFVLYDQRGSLHSPSPDSLISFENHIEDLELLRKALKLEKISIMGHSMGAVLASAYATRYPENVAALTLVTPAYLRTQFGEEEQRVYDLQSQNQQKFMNRPEVDQELEKYALNEENLSPQQNTAKFRINFARRMLFDVKNWSGFTGGRSFYQGHVYGLTESTYPKTGWDYISEFKEQAYPVSFIAASHDFLDFGNGLISKWAKDIQRSGLQIIPEAGHMVWIDQPVVFKNALRNALAK